jgi:hypothetical protein
MQHLGRLVRFTPNTMPAIFPDDLHEPPAQRRDFTNQIALAGVGYIAIFLQGDIKIDHVPALR